MVSNAKVLMIDDDQDCRAFVKVLLESNGYTFVEADCGKEGLRKVREHRPDLILVDVMMECDSEGYDITQAIKHRAEYADFRNVPVLMLSSIQESPDELFPMAPESEMIRPDRYLTKPIDASVLLEAVRKALPERHAQAV
jgi:CheY-like chemotaxis protein